MKNKLMLAVLTVVSVGSAMAMFGPNVNPATQGRARAYARKPQSKLPIAGHMIQVINSTNEQIIVKINYKAKGVCSRDEIVVNPGAERFVDAMACCVDADNPIIVSDEKGQMKRFVPPVTGARMSCRSFTMNVRKARNGKLVVESSNY